jgi:tRNA-binding protein
VPTAEPKPQITFGKFQNVDLRVARVLAAPLADGTRYPTRVFRLDVGPLGELRSVGQFALVDEAELIGRHVVVCVNLGTREMGPYVSEALVLGAPHPQNPEGQSQATPLHVSSDVAPGAQVF